MGDDRHSLLQMLAHTRARLAVRFWTEGVLRAVEGLLLLLLFALGLWALSAPTWLVQLGFWLPALAYVGWLALKFMLRPRTLYNSRRAVAAYIERRIPALQNRMLSATEFALATPGELRFSRALAERVVSEVGRQVKGLNPGELVPWRKLRWVAVRVIAIVALTAGLSALFPLHMQQALAVVAGLSDRANGEAMRVLAGDITLHYTYPAYTGLDAVTVPNSSGDIEAYPGTNVTLSVRAIDEVDSAELELSDGATVKLSPVGNGRFSGELTVGPQAGHYVFAFDGDREGRKREIAVINDRKPNVALDYPPLELEVRDSDRIELAFRAEDDFGLTGLELVVEFATADGRETRRFPIKSFAGDTRRHEGTHLWDLATMTFRPGDRVTYFVEAADNDTIGGPQIGQSATHTLKVFSVYEHHEKLIERQEQVWETMLEILGKYLEQDISDKTIKLPTELLSALTNSATELHDGLVNPLTELVKELEDDPLATDAVRVLMRTMLSDFSQNRDDYRDQHRQLEEYGLHQTDLTYGIFRMRALRGQSTEKLERYIMDLYELLKKQKYDSLLSESQKLSDLRDEIRRLLDEYKRTGDEALKRRIAELLKEFRQRLNEMMAKMSDISKELPEEFVNMEAMQAHNMNQNLDSLEKLLESGDLDKAFSQMENLSLQLNEMMKNLEEGSQDLGESLYSESMQKMMGMQKDLEQMIAKERELHEQTQQKYDEYRKKAEELLKKNLERKLTDLIAKVKQARKALSAVDVGSNPMIDRYLDGALTRLEDLLKALNAQDINGSLETARIAERNIESIVSMLGGYWPNVNADMRVKNINNSRTAQQRVKEVIDALKDIMPDPRDMMSQKDLQQMQQMAQRQQQLLQEAQRMRRQMQQMMDEMPFMPGDSGQQMDQASSSMDQSRGQLQQAQPGRAEGHQQQALHSLQQIQQALQQAMQQMQNSMQPGGMQPQPGQRGPGRKMSREDVAIPQAEDHQAPKALREDILDAMKRKAPESYKPQTNQYYKELVR